MSAPARILPERYDPAPVESKWQGVWEREDAFGAEEVARDRVDTPLGEAVRLEYALAPRNGVALTAVEYVIGAPAGTLLVSVLGPADAVAAQDPDALVAAMAPLP